MRWASRDGINKFWYIHIEYYIIGKNDEVDVTWKHM